MSGSPIVCQIPDCATTQAEIEAELKSFLSGFCSICKKDRLGKLCGCAFPCSLTFRAQMLQKIHELLGQPKPPNRRAIQVIRAESLWPRFFQGFFTVQGLNRVFFTVHFLNFEITLKP